jgi:hypothetical protein
MRPDRAQSLNQAPLADLLAVLLRQVKRLLAQRGIELNDAAIRALAEQVAAGQLPADLTDDLRAALAEVVTESEQVLARWNLTFAQSLATDMSAMPGWETTADFLEIANEKGNAELRIAAAAALLAALADWRCAAYALDAIDHDPHEIETVTARRVLARASGIPLEAPNWRAQVEAWLRQQAS